MKKFKILLFVCLLCCGCFKRDTMEDITIYASYYPIEFITSRLYGDNSDIHSIYPDGTNPDETELTEKQVKDFSKSELFIFSGLSKEKNYLSSMLKYNNDLKIIDSTLSMQTNEIYGNELEELWLDPNNLLMISRNIKDGLDEYITNHYLKNEIANNYSDLKIELSQLSAKLHQISSTSNNPTIVVSNDLLKFLENYGFVVYSLEKNDEKTIKIVQGLFKEDKVHYVFMTTNDQETDVIKDLNTNYKAKIGIINTLSTITSEERDNKENYITIMKENINLLKEEIFE